MTDVIVIGGGASGMMAAAASSCWNGRAGWGASCWPPATAGAT